MADYFNRNPYAMPGQMANMGGQAFNPFLSMFGKQLGANNMDPNAWYQALAGMFQQQPQQMRPGQPGQGPQPFTATPPVAAQPAGSKLMQAAYSMFGVPAGGGTQSLSNPYMAMGQAAMI